MEMVEEIQSKNVKMVINSLWMVALLTAMLKLDGIVYRTKRRKNVTVLINY